MKILAPSAVREYPAMTVLIYDRRYDLMYALARFQEFYEHRVLAGKVFERAELQVYDPDYYVSWNGCNFPAGIVAAIRANPAWSLDRHEVAALALMPVGHYIAGVHRERGPHALTATLKHEYAHALFDTDPIYRAMCCGLIDQYRVRKEPMHRAVCDKLCAMGYPPNRTQDEFQAYARSGWERLGLDFAPPLELLMFQEACGGLGVRFEGIGI